MVLTLIAAMAISMQASAEVAPPTKPAPPPAVADTFASPQSNPSKLIEELARTIPEARESFRVGVTATACLEAGLSVALVDQLLRVVNDDAVKALIMKPGTEVLAFSQLCGVGERKSYREVKPLALESDPALQKLDSLLHTKDYDTDPTLPYSSVAGMTGPLKLLDFGGYLHKKHRYQLCFSAGMLDAEMGFYGPMFRKLDADRAMSFSSHVRGLKTACRQNGELSDVDTQLLEASIVILYEQMNWYRTTVAALLKKK